ncbi:MAG: endonuclease V, partial [Nanoarchaeota archaeon]
EVKGEDIVLNDKVVGKVFHSKKGSNPLYISPGNLISVDSALKITKEFMKHPHKLPEPLHLAGKYGRKMEGEIFPKTRAQ